MPTFIDESGDTGTEQTSSQSFLLAAVQVPTKEVAEEMREGIRGLRQELKLKSNFEFKFSKLKNHRLRCRRFFEQVMESPFYYLVVSLDKTTDLWRGATKNDIHLACAFHLSNCLAPVYDKLELERGEAINEIVVLDDNQDKKFLRAVQTEICRPTSAIIRGRKHVKNVRFQHSGPDEMLQLADMVVGVTGDFLAGKSEDLYDIIKPRCLKIVTIP